jgi:NADPH-dependent curcumin reductase CurA
MPTNTQILLDHRPTDKVSPANFRIVETPVPTPGPGQVLVRHSFLSLDPYMRGRLSDAKSYAKPQEIGAVMGGGTVGVVEASNNPRFKRINDFARVAVCGLIASYESEPTPPPDMRLFLVKRFKMEGFIVSDHMDLWPKALGELAGLVAAKKLVWRETIRDGLESAPQALVDLLHGQNFGKMLVRVD